MELGTAGPPWAVYRSWYTGQHLEQCVWATILYYKMMFGLFVTVTPISKGLGSAADNFSNYSIGKNAEPIVMLCRNIAQKVALRIIPLRVQESRAGSACCADTQLWHEGRETGSREVGTDRHIRNPQNSVTSRIPVSFCFVSCFVMFFFFWLFFYAPLAPVVLSVVTEGLGFLNKNKKIGVKG